MLEVYTRIFAEVALFFGILFLVYKHLRKKDKTPEWNKSKIYKGSILTVLGIILNIAETKYFGWNMTAQSMEENVWDWITGGILFVSMMIVYQGFFPDKTLKNMLKRFTKVKKEIVYETESIKITIFTRKNNVLKDENDIHLLFWNKNKKEYTVVLPIETRKGDHRKEVVKNLKEHLPQLLTYKVIQKHLKLNEKVTI